ncbi:trypsin-like serine peptidase [Hyphobacterium indicum]|jgi:hypothetical protein|uniref:trypsin-like serine peptidase n=1 Tax=Hyphobacterium indicum TaxID=2162714 RepID=UPI000D64B9B8|nr:hypothetical protein [Hyphobacterium indicum]
MIIRALVILGFVTFPVGANDIQPAAMESPVPGRDGLVDLVCPLPGSSDRFVSQAFVVEFPQAQNFEVLVATRHGAGGLQALDNAACWIRGPSGETYSISDSRYSRSNATDDHDWLVIRTEQEFEPEVARLTLARVQVPLVDLPDIALVRQSRIPTACHVLAQTEIFHNDGSLFAHDCRTRPGLSGSPIMIAHDGVNVVVGFHLGRVTQYSAGTSQQYGLARLIDAEIEQAIMDLASQAN